MMEIVTKSIVSSGMGLTEFARKLKVSRQTIDRWKKGKARPKAHHLAMIKELATPKITVIITEQDFTLSVPKDMSREQFKACLTHLLEKLS